MTLVADGSAFGGAAYAPRFVTSLERLRSGLLWLTGFAGAFVFMEPSPYEVASLLTILVFAATGLTLRPALMPLLLLLLLLNVGFSIAVVPVLADSKTLVWVLVSWYMAATAVFFAAMLSSNTEQRLDMLMRGYSVAAIVTSVVAVLAYFHAIPGGDLFIRFDRARGTFNDPNVLGAFLILPVLIAVKRVISGNAVQALRACLPLAIMLMALLLSFSRGAWGQLAFSATLMLLLMLLTTRSNRERMRIIGIAAMSAAGIAAFILLLLAVDQVGALFTERASLEQEYDTGHLGRFGRHILGFALALEKPFGIGPLQFVTIFPEDPHNSYLNAFMSGGWLAGFSYLTLVAVTVFMGLRYVFVTAPWQPIYFAVYAAYLGVVGESAIIDSDHWRHYFLLLGVLWGLMLASHAYRRRRWRNAVTSDRPPSRVPVIEAASFNR
jgi:O-Antigen ligase